MFFVPHNDFLELYLKNDWLQDPYHYPIIYIPELYKFFLNVLEINLWKLHIGLENFTGDTTFGYISADFRGGTNCDDTLFVNSHTYMNPSNITLTGGQIITDIAVIKSNLNIYPNPTSDQITIDIKNYNGPVEVDVYDLQGRLLETTRTTTLSLSKYERGIYIFKVNYGDITEEVRVVRD